MIAETEKKEILKTLNELGRAHGVERVFRDWCNMTAMAFSNACTLQYSKLWKKREEEYKKILERYGDNEPFAHMTTCLTNIFEEDTFNDHLGRIYMETFGGNRNLGQVFTPYSVARACAVCAIEKPTAEFKRVNDCACGGGAMLIAACEAYHKAGVNYQRYLKLYAEDLDTLCVHMCYIQLSLIGARAIVSCRNSLTMETFDRFITPMEYLWPMTLASPEKATDLPSCGVQKTGESRQKQNNAGQGAGTREPIQLRLFKEVSA